MYCTAVCDLNRRSDISNMKILAKEFKKFDWAFLTIFFIMKQKII